MNTVTFRYKNHRGESAIRTVLPRGIWYGKTQWHPTEQWFLAALDIDKDRERDFAMSDISEWRTVADTT